MSITLSKELRNFTTDSMHVPNEGPILDEREMMDLLGVMMAWILSTDTFIQFLNVNGPTVDNAYAGPLAGTLVSVGVTNGVGILDPFNNTATVLVSVTGGTATSPRLNGSASPVLLTMVDGRASLTVSATGAGTVLLGLSGGNTTLSLADTATVTLS